MKVLIYGWKAAEGSNIPEMNEAIVSIMKKLNYDYVIYEKDAPGAELIGFYGYMDVLEKYARKTKNEIEKIVKEENVDVMVSGWGSHYAVWNNEIKELGYGLSIPVEQIATFLYKNLNRMKFKEMKKRVMVYDCCRLGRNLGMTKEPREVLRSIPGVEIVEIGHPELQVKERNLNTWDTSPCVAAKMKITMPELAPYVVENVVRVYIEPENVDFVTSACGNAYRALKEGILFGNHKTKAISLPNLVDLALEGVRE